MVRRWPIRNMIFNQYLSLVNVIVKVIFFSRVCQSICSWRLWQAPIQAPSDTPESENNFLSTVRLKIVVGFDISNHCEHFNTATR